MTEDDQHCLICDGPIHRNAVDTRVLDHPVWLHDRLEDDEHPHPHYAVQAPSHDGPRARSTVPGMVAAGVLLIVIALVLVAFGVLTTAVKGLVVIGVILLIGGVVLALVGRRRLR